MQPLARGVLLRLPDASPFDGGLHVVQLVQARYQLKGQSFQSVIESDSRHFSLYMSVPSGPAIMQVNWSDDQIETHKEKLAPLELTGERILTDLMLVYASSPSLRRALSGAILIEDVRGGMFRRSIFKRGQEIIRVSRPIANAWKGKSVLENFAFDYALTIQSQWVAP